MDWALRDLGGRRGGAGRHDRTGRVDQVDAWLALLLLMLCVFNIAVDERLRGVDLLEAVPLALAMTAALAMRRRMPETTLLVALAAWVVQVVLENGLLATAPALYAVVSTVAVHGAPWAMGLALAGGLSASVLAATWSIAREDMPVGAAIQLAVAMLLPFSLSWALGYRARFRRCYRHQLAESADSSLRIDAARRQVALATQRAEICREMYDITGHRVAGMVVQAEAAGRVLDRAPGQARQALRTIASSGRESECDLHRTRGVLRDDGRP
ncbi:DUF7134 domain-containing protein [Streptomyces hainanensis]|uniref:histidine kinase n=1 Tax=Streptomyces hainanensis TaxID=402648 RepID=A0A4R4TH42_9ACTN|nr:histidine kinase [Streptomyces hainanensis]TDC76981.1 histidine kinase [Streptomyces hainanensis]